MKSFHISKKIKHQVEKIFKDFNIEDEDVKETNTNELEYDEIQEGFQKILNFSSVTTPLFASLDGLIAGKNAVKFNSNALAIQEIIINIEKLSDYDFITEKKIPRNLSDILTCAELYVLFGSQLLEIDYKCYDFNNAFDMFISISFYIIEKNNNRSITRTVDVLDEERSIIYQYDDHIHSDFRLTIYNKSDSSVEMNPCNENEKLPFSYYKKKQSINGYHSEEPSFLVALLMVIYNDKNNDIFDDMKSLTSYIEGLDNELCNCADAGINSLGKVDFAFINFDSGGAGCISIENSRDYYQSELVNGNLHYYLMVKNEKMGSPIIIHKNIANQMIKGLLLKSSKGNGRTSLAELLEILSFYIENYKEKENAQ